MHWRLFEDYGRGIEVSKKWRLVAE